jgi:hypothetical protein
MERQRPGALSLIAILAILLGILIILRGGYSIAELTFQDFLFQIGEIPERPNASPELREQIAQGNQVRREVLEIQRAWNPINWALAPLAAIFGIVLIVAGQLCFKISRFGRKLMVATCLVGIAFDLARASAAILLDIQKTELIQGYMVRSADAAPGDTEVMGAAMGLVVAFTATWVFIKALFYLWAVIYLTRARVRDLFELGVWG